MAEGRMLKKNVSTSRRLAELMSDSARLLWTWILPHLDVAGRFSGEASVIKGSVVPRLKHMTEERVGRLLTELHDSGLIRLYTVDGERYLELRRFEDFQNLRINRESESKIPEPIEHKGDKDNSGSSPGVVRDYSIPRARRDKDKDKDKDQRDPSGISGSAGVIKAVVEYLNDKAGKKFTPKSSDTIKHITARIGEGRTLEDFKRVVDIKVAKWKGKTWNDTRPGREGQTVHGEDFLCPSTLFCAKNFETYLNESGPSKRLTAEEFKAQQQAELEQLREKG